jgi:hypothetical protein
VTTIELSYRLNDNWPPGAWIAHGRRGSAEVEVTHGSGVLVSSDWFGEIVWAGPFADADFDLTDIVFGSGGRLRDGGLTFVSSATTVDRLQALERGSDFWVSNSLACLFAATGAMPDRRYLNYARDFRTITHGLKGHRRSIPTTAEPVRLVYFNNLRWDASRLAEVAKPNPHRDFSSFPQYRAFVDEALAKLAANMGDATRALPYQFLGTVSSGYDSPAVAALARGHGLTEVITFTEARSGQADSGAAVAEALGLKVRAFPRDGWQRNCNVPASPETPFLASDGKGEDVFFRAAEPLLRGRVLITGFHGDKMWDSATTALGPDIVRGDQSGLSLTEYRLWAGFVHFPLAFLGVRQIRDVHALSHAPELAAWDVGGDYTRPICRRVVEEAGVPRGAFGQEKKAASVHFYYVGNFLSEGSTRDFLAWLRGTNGRRPPMLGQRSATQTVMHWAAGLLRRTAERWPAGSNPLRRAGNRLAKYADRERLFAHVFPWAIERVIDRYRMA